MEDNVKKQLAIGRRERRAHAREKNLTEVQLCVVCTENPKEVRIEKRIETGNNSFVTCIRSRRRVSLRCKCVVSTENPGKSAKSGRKHLAVES